MRKVVSYYAEGNALPFSNEEDCRKAEEEFLERAKRWQQETAEAKLDKLKHDLEQASIIPLGTIATCSYTALAIKNLVKVCQAFVEQNKQYLNYY